MGTTATQTLIREDPDGRIEPSEPWMDDHDHEQAGHDQVVSVTPLPDPPTAVLAKCTCPDFCERDHGNE